MGASWQGTWRGQVTYRPTQDQALPPGLCSLWGAKRKTKPRIQTWKRKLRPVGDCRSLVLFLGAAVAGELLSSLAEFSWLVPALMLSSPFCGRIFRSLKVDRGLWLIPVYNFYFLWVLKYCFSRQRIKIEGRVVKTCECLWLLLKGMLYKIIMFLRSAPSGILSWILPPSHLI